MSLERARTEGTSHGDDRTDTAVAMIHTVPSVSLPSTLKIAVFGTGEQAERAWTVIQSFPGLSIVAVADNAVAKRGSIWHGQPILNAADLVAFNEWDYVCVASRWHAEIVNQLMGLGVAPDRIAVLGAWGEGGLVAGVERLQCLFPASGSSAGAVPGFEDDFSRLALLRRLGFAPDVVLDVGASSGPWSVTCARVFPRAHYYLVEPLPHYEEQLLTETAGAWHRLPLALGAEDGEAIIAVPTSNYGAFGATLLPTSAASAETLRVPLRRINTLLAEGTLARPQLVKLDVQGYEAAVLAGGERLWESVEVFFVELSMDRFWTGAHVLSEMIDLFGRHGFLPFDFFHEFRSPDGILRQIDCVFLRRDGPLALQHHLWAAIER